MNIDISGIHSIIRKLRTPTLAESTTQLDRAIACYRAAPSISTLSMVREFAAARYNAETADYLLERMAEYGLAPRITHNLATPEGYLAAMEEYLMKEMTLSGASFGGGFSGSGTNADINATGRAGVDPVMNIKKRLQTRKIDKILGI